MQQLLIHHAISFAQVEKIIFEDKKAIGVEYRKGNKLVKVNTKKEIIISAGAFQSPQLLMLSGIGESLELNKHGIKTIHELKGVGKNLQDHLFFPRSCIGFLRYSHTFASRKINK